MHTPPSYPRRGSFIRRITLVLTCLSLTSLLAQSTPAPPQDPADLAAASTSPVLTLKTETRRVGVDIVVTDPQGHVVTGLKREDFSVEENNAPQPVRSFEVHTVASEAPYVAPKVPQLPPNTFLNILKAPEAGTPTVILYDALNTPLDSQAYGHEEILRFLEHRRPGTQIAVFVLGSKLHLLQGFTEDPDLLTAAFASKKGAPQTTTLLPPAPSVAGIATSGAPTGPTGAGVIIAPNTGPANGDVAYAAALAAFTHMDTLELAQYQDERLELTLNALTEIGRFLASIPGRKNLIWYSSDFPAGIFPSDSALNHDQTTRDYSAEIKQTTDLLNISHVAVYPIDVRGVRVHTSYSAARNSSFGGSSTNFNAENNKFILGDAVTRASMDSIADNTGGRAFYGTNDLQEAVNQAMMNGSTYYSLTYAPTDPNFDGSLRRIKVKLDKPGYTLAYRRTYYADDLRAAVEAVSDAPQNPLTPSLEHGTPLSHQLFIEAHIDAGGAPVPATPAQMELLSQYEAMRTKKKNKKTPSAPPPPVMMQKYYISYGLIGRQLDMPADGKGNHQASLELGVLSYDEDGRKLNGLDNRVDDTIPAPRYAKLATDGYHAVQAVLIPVTAASVRLAVRDVNSNRIGSIEVQLPLAKTAEANIPELKTLAK